MRDITQDLRERLAKLDGRQIDAEAKYDEESRALAEAHRSEITDIDRQRRLLKDLLAIEQGNAQPSLSKTEPMPQPKQPLADLLLTTVQVLGHATKEQLKDMAADHGYDDGRSVHFTLMNLVNGGKLAKDPIGRYVLPDSPRARVFSEDKEEGDMLRLM